jgi:hypothetical protein
MAKKLSIVGFVKNNKMGNVVGRVIINFSK